MFNGPVAELVHGELLESPGEKTVQSSVSVRIFHALTALLPLDIISCSGTGNDPGRIVHDAEQVFVA